MSRLTCPHCGVDIPADAVRCPECRGEVGPLQEAGMSRWGAILMVVVFAVAILAALIAGWRP
jgi:hypothetical protein